MLQAIRTRAGSIIVKALFALLILSFGFWGIYTRSPYFQGHSPDTVIATVGDEQIRADELQRALQPTIERLRAQFGGNLDQRQLKQFGIVDRVLTELIDQKLLDQEAARLRLVVSDEVIRSAIYDNPAFRTPDGRFDRALFDRVLAANRLTEDQLIVQLRRELPRSDLLQALAVGVGAARAEVDALYRYRNEKRFALIVAIPAATAGGVGEPSEADLAKFYDAHKAMFRAPEYRGFTMISLGPADLAAGITIAEDRLREEYEQRKDEFALPERRQVEQILAPSEEKAKAAEAALAAGKDWKEVATTIAGQDADSIDLGLVAQGELPPELAEAAFGLQLNQRSPPIKTAFGWHILRIVKIEPAATQTFEQVKEKLAAALVHDEAVDRLAKLGNTVDDALAGGGKLDEVARKFGLKLVTVAAADQAGRDLAGKPVALPLPAAPVLKVVFDTEKDQTSRVIDTDEGAIFAVRTDTVTPPQVPPLAEVKGKAVAAWQADQKRVAAAKQAVALAAAVASAGAGRRGAGDPPRQAVRGKSGRDGHRRGRQERLCRAAD